MRPFALALLLALTSLAPAPADAVRPGYIPSGPDAALDAVPPSFARSIDPAPPVDEGQTPKPQTVMDRLFKPATPVREPVEPTAYVQPNPPAVAQATATKQASPDACSCSCQCDRCRCTTPRTGIATPAPQRYTLADASGQAWYDTDAANLSRWVAYRNAQVQGQRYGQSAYGQSYAPPTYAQPTIFGRPGYSAGPVFGGYSGGSCAGGSCR